MYLKIKPVLDVGVATTAFLFFCPIFCAISVAILLSMGWPIFFIQKRIGLNEREFDLYKFRTMCNAPPNTPASSDMQRLTLLGRFLRRTSLDELPQLLNILKGDMSIVGPRPLLVHYLPRYNAWQKRRHEVKPGLTGLAQVMGRNTLDWDQKFRFDVEYVDEVSFLLDVKIILMTILVLFKGINKSKEHTMEEFNP